jgi:predicted ArsR family transcriptional regulator
MIRQMGKRTLERDIEALNSLREPTRRAIYEHVARQPHAVSRDEAAAAFGIKRSLAAFHLDRLVDAGLLAPEYRRLSGRTGPGAGRPAKLYRRSRRRLLVSVPPRNPELLAALLAASMPPRDPSHGTLDSAREVGQALGATARKRVSRSASKARLFDCVEAVLDHVGFEPYRPNDGELRVRNCPFDPMSRRYTAVVCNAAVALARGIIKGAGAEVLVTREERRDQCCLVLIAEHPITTGAGGLQAAHVGPACSDVEPRKGRGCV